ncbi:two domain sensory box histidine kinase (PAS/PAC domain/GGDEF domain protein) [Desulforapulum autotrophicum HRM2]|uniref:Two domain sensory box histidine kinase (PAS/PAC domain/GGDEF domain protein) n=1 Tax=Desulforapulum autotrophicum (strain ATCC 43914 / DSM 3382 / VKM B-1955 / HRM2) TaxID=177437 RepID=C0QJJ3_DESAH|nr:PAS and helix-turn-helix domain-containing protein [Desulforapulum autotrophicum]ACN13846.1 two domain sensory box histidine kinase (PAS/PAC domain/GGDEF domain protein) [Desulforapulum autotrophicum HRM2]
MTRQYAETILNSLSAHIAIIDSNGIIIDTNKAWREFAISNNPGMRPDMLNINYLKICDAANGETAGSAAQVAMGIRQVIKGDIDEFVMDYPCHSPGNKRWFYMRAVRVAGSQPLQIVVSHENITPLKIAEHKLLQREAELKQKTLGLEEANAALRALLRHRDEDLKEMEQTFFQNLKQTIFPSFDQLKKLNPSGKEKKIISLIESELNNIASPFLRHISNFEAVLTPQELKIASLIKQGQSSKEIADLLNLSITTVNFHRRNLRDKLGLKNTATNLNTFLLHLN